MSDRASQISESSQLPVNALVLPVGNAQLLAPLAAIAEVTSDELPIIPLKQNDERFYGWIIWRNQHLPVLSYESVSGSSRAPLNAESTVVIVNAVGAAKARGFYGLVLQGFPRRIDINEADESKLLPSLEELPGVLYRVELNGESMLVPDFDLFETLCADAPLLDSGEAETTNQ